MQANIIGVVLNDVKISQSNYYHYAGYYYSKKYSKGYPYAEKDTENPKNSEASNPDQDTLRLLSSVDLKKVRQKRSYNS